jgi:hypothetical protein
MGLGRELVLSEGLVLLISVGAGNFVGAKKKILSHIYSYYYVHIYYTKAYTNIWCLCVHCNYDVIVLNMFKYVLSGNLKINS